MTTAGNASRKEDVQTTNTIAVSKAKPNDEIQRDTTTCGFD
jgi:hypothetical protein